jgi:hypothetical protein
LSTNATPSLSPKRPRLLSTREHELIDAVVQRLTTTPRSDRAVKILLWLAHPHPNPLLDGDYEREEYPNGLLFYDGQELHENTLLRDCVDAMARLCRMLVRRLTPLFTNLQIQVHDFCSTAPRIGDDMDGSQMQASLQEADVIRQRFFDNAAINIDMTTLKIHNITMVG